MLTKDAIAADQFHRVTAANLDMEFKDNQIKKASLSEAFLIWFIFADLNSSLRKPYLYWQPQGVAR